ncbi:nose resistant to fluoxetine protein 6-like [Ornithodoros turicata]|uniref:nose resistant to fluoxetine protein 6-like n=1 Tax=Ornithodoros turicata TaxID=34597 RepID=UPI00313A08C0
MTPLWWYLTVLVLGTWCPSCAIDIRPVLEDTSAVGNRTFGQRHTDNSSRESQDQLEENVVELWQMYDEGLRGQVDNLLRQALPYLLEIGDVGINIRCAQALLKIVFGLRKLDKWAFQLLDSIGRPPSGILDVTMSDYGDYDQCLQVVSLFENGTEDFRGQHCNIQIEHPNIPQLNKHAIAKLPLILKDDSVYKDVLLTYTRLHVPIGVRVGICVPSTCSNDDVFKMLNPAAANLKLGIRVAGCETKDIVSLSEEQLVAICLFGLLGTFLLLGTLLDVVLRTLKRPAVADNLRQNVGVKTLSTFGLVGNVQELLSGSDVQSSLRCLHGLRVLTISWIVLTQTYFSLEFQAVRGLRFLISSVESIPFQVVANGFLAADTFFFLSGLLLALSVLRSMDKNNFFKQIVGRFLYRYLRLTPGCLLAVAFVLLLPLLGSGPIWMEKITGEVESCRKNWWAVAFNINNFVYQDGMCLPSLWHVSADWQLHLALFLIVLLLIRKPAFGGMAAFASVVISGVIVGVQTTLSGYPPTMLPLSADRSRIMTIVQEVVMRPYTHAGPFTIGVCTAFLLFRYPHARLRTVVQVAFWVASLLMMGSSLFGTWRWNRSAEATDLEVLIYSSIHRSAWALGLSWIVYACATRRGGFLNRLLSWKALVPLSRLTFGVYLAHPIVLFFQMWTIRERIYGSHVTMIYLFLGNMAFSYGIAAVFYVAFEAPFRKLSKRLLESVLGCCLQSKSPAIPSGGNSASSSIKKPMCTDISMVSVEAMNGGPVEKVGTLSVHL